MTLPASARMKIFRDSLAGRNMDITTLAKRAGCGRSHLTLVLLGKRSGPETRAKLVNYLTPEELTALGWSTGALDYQI